MSRVALPDVNVLIALAWPNHHHHLAAHRWFAERRSAAWATTPVTESGFVRVSANRAALPAATTPGTARELMAAMRRQRGHRFWVDDVELVTGVEGQPQPATHRDVTDAHLLAVAAAHDGVLVSFDTGIERLLGGLPAHVLRVL